MSLPARQVRKRIVMNPPDSFIMAAAAAQAQSGNTPMNGPLVIDQNGQAVMMASSSAIQTDLSTASLTDSTTATPTVSTLQTVTTTSIIQTSLSSVTPTQTASLTSQVATTSAVVTSTVSTALSTSTSLASLSTSTMASSASPLQNEHTVFTSTSASSLRPTSTESSSSASSASSMPAHSSSAAVAVPFTHSAPFIFLVLLGSLILIAVIATLVSWYIRTRRPSWLCCFHPNDDDPDGLDEIVRSFEGPSRASSIRSRRSMREIDDPESQIQRRAGLFATDPSQSPFLHSGTSAPPFEFMYGADTGSPSITSPPAAHLLGGSGPLEVRNITQEDLDEAYGKEEHGTPRETEASFTPRFLSVDGNGLEVPWGHAMEHTPSPYMSPPDARDYLGPPFPSPPSTIEEEPEYPTSTNWATNLRSTLFAAIGGKAPAQVEDKFTRPVLPLHRGNTRKSLISQPVPIIIQEKDEEYHMPPSDAEAIGHVFLAPNISRNSSAESRMNIQMPKRMKKMPLRSSVGERYKRYARSTSGRSSGLSSASEDSSTESSGWSEIEQGRVSRLAGGERAKGVKGEF
ncbi:hypothetical protein P7C73_g2162, partial [Tremellales sp. Uapishka_1]